MRYFHQVVLEAHQQILEIRGPWADPRAHPAVMPAIDVTARLAALAAQLPPGLPHRKRWSRQLVELDGDVEEVEERLQEIDRQVLEAAGAALSAQDREELEEQLSKAMAKLGQLLPPLQLRRIEEHLRERLLREKLDLPVLSIFAPEATEERPFREAAACPKEVISNSPGLSEAQPWVREINSKP